MSEWFKIFFSDYDAAGHLFNVFVFWVLVVAVFYIAKNVLGFVARFRQIDIEKWFGRIDSVRDRVDILGFFALVGCSVLVPIDVYVSYFGNRPMSSEPAEWGQMGDFFGGMLNPILAFASFMALLYTIRIQSEELRLTKDEIKRSADAQTKIALEAKMQSNISKIQLIQILTEKSYAEGTVVFEKYSNKVGFYNKFHDYSFSVRNYVQTQNDFAFRFNKVDQVVISFLVDFLVSIDGLSENLITEKGFIFLNSDSMVSKQQVASVAKTLRCIPIGNLVKIFTVFGLPGREHHPTVQLFVKYNVGFLITELIKDEHNELLNYFANICEVTYLKISELERHMLWGTSPFRIQIDTPQAEPNFSI